MIVQDKEGNFAVHINLDLLNIGELQMRKMAILDLIASQNEDMQSNETTYFAIQVIKDMEPSEEQYQKMFK